MTSTMTDLFRGVFIGGPFDGQHRQLDSRRSVVEAIAPPGGTSVTYRMFYEMDSVGLYKPDSLTADCPCVGGALNYRPPTQNATGDLVLMPARLTAENGAKAMLIGEFFETIEHPCHCQCGQGPEDCDACFLTDEEMIPETLQVPVSWSTIKSIYRRAVENLQRPLFE